VIGYTDFFHLLPAYLGAIVFAGGLFLSAAQSGQRVLAAPAPSRVT
jgi:hypothetical protein